MGNTFRKSWESSKLSVKKVVDKNFLVLELKFIVSHVRSVFSSVFQCFPKFG